MKISPIGRIHTVFHDKFATPRQPGLVTLPKAKIEIFPEFQPQDSLQGLEKFSHIWVLFHFHLNRPGDFQAKIRPPRLGGEKVGVFASRSPHRPNPIGMSLLRLIAVESPYVIVEGVDIVDQTPILDIKPFLDDYDQPHGELEKGWPLTAPEPRYTVGFDADAITLLDTLSSKPEHDSAVLAEVLSHEVRTIQDRRKANKEKKHVMAVAGLDVSFSVDDSEQKVTIHAIRPCKLD